MTRTIFRDFDEFAEAINGIAGRFVPTAQSEKDWWVQVVPAGRVAIQQVQIGGASTFVGDGTPDGITIGIPVNSSRRVRIDGKPIQENSFILGKQGQPFTFAAGQATCWAGIHIPADHASLTPGLLESLKGKEGTYTRTQLPYITKARLLVTRLFAEDDSISLAGLAAVRAVEEEIVSTISHSLEASDRFDQRRTGRPRLPRGRIVARTLQVIEESEGQPLFLGDLCHAAQVSERTLRNVFKEYFGVGPMRLLKVNRLSEIRSALIAADPRAQTISSIVGHFGVWDFSSFARNYKALYNETASETMRRSANSPHRHRGTDARWIKYASQKFVGVAHLRHP